MYFKNVIKGCQVTLVTCLFGFLLVEFERGFMVEFSILVIVVLVGSDYCQYLSIPQSLCKRF